MSIVALRSSQVVDKLTATPGTLMTFLELFLDHILGFGLRSGTSTLAAHGYASTDLASSRVDLNSLSRTWLARIHLGKVLLVRERVRPELLGLLAGTLLIGTHLLLLLAHGEVVLPVLIHINIHGVTTLLLSSHDKARRGLARVINDNVVYVVVIDDVGDVLAAPGFCLNALLRVSRRWSSTPHPEALTVRVSGSLEASIVLTLLRHGVFSQFLRATDRSLLIVSVAVDKVVVLF